MNSDQIAKWLGRSRVGPAQNPEIVMVYIYPQGGANGWKERADAFVDSYVANPPGYKHKTAVICNGHQCNEETIAVFSRLPETMFLEHDNSGFDIGGYQKAAAEIPADIMLFCGSYTYFRQPEWMIKMIDAYYQFGDTLYGAMGNTGDKKVNVYPHIRTTGFWCSPVLINKYPHKVTEHGGGGSGSKRYFFEHGNDSLTMWARRQGFQPQIICSHGAFPMPHCNGPETLHKGNQLGLLMGDRLTRPPYYHCA